jgi:hypothetical protein
MVCLFVLFYTLMVLGFFLLASDLFSAGILIAPLLIAISMLFDGFSSGPLAAMEHINGAHFPAPTVPGKFFSLTLVHVGLLLAVIALPSPAVYPNFAWYEALWKDIRIIALPALLAVMADRFLSVSYSREHSEPSARAWATPWVCLVVSVGLVPLIQRALHLTFTYRITWLFFWLLVCTYSMLLVGLVQGLSMPKRLKKTLETEGGRTPLSWIGIRTHPRSAGEKLGVAIYIIRQYTFWLLTAYALWIATAAHFEQSHGA